MFTGDMTLRASIAIMGFACLWAPALPAQGTDAPASEPTATPVPAIAIPEVTDRSQEVQNRLKQIDDDVSSATMALFRGFTDTGFAFRMLFWIPTAKALTAPSEVGLAVFDGLEREGYDMPIPRHLVDVVRERTDDEQA